MNYNYNKETMSNIQIRIDDKMKNDVKNILDNIGLDFSSAIKIYFHQILNKKGIPFELKTENGFSIIQENRILKSVKTAKNNNKKFINSKDLINELDS